MILPLTAEQIRCLARLREAHPTLRVVLIGAGALGCHVRLSRTTADVDLAMVAAPERFEELFVPLGWRRDRQIQQRWYDPNGVVADILPATREVLDVGHIRFEDDAREMSVLGFDLALDHSVSVLLPGVHLTLDVAALAPLVVLKMVSWLDRPAERTKDLGDLALVLNSALDDDDERRWDPEHPVSMSGLDHEDQSAFFVGHEVARIARDAHHAKVARFLDKVSDESSVWFAQMLREARYGGEDPEERLLRRLLAFRRGIASVRGAS